MRDGQIIDMQNKNTDRFEKAYRQLGFIDTRLQAVELVLKTMNLVEKVRFLISPKSLIEKIDKVHIEMLISHDQAVLEKLKKANVPHGKMALAFVLLGLMLSSCVTLKTNKLQVEQARQAGFKDAEVKCNEIQIKISQYIGALQERLIHFGQLDEKGYLKPLVVPEK